MENKWIRKCAIYAFIVLLIYFLFQFLSPSPQPINDFDIAFEFVLKWEGGLSEDPNDPGGLTKYGISQKAYPHLDIKNLTVYNAKEIYYKDYWLKSGCDELVPPMDLIVFNCSVNCGVSKTKSLFLTSEGNWKDFLLKQIEHYSSLHGAKYYLRGWINRTMDLYKQIKEGK